jgi:plasmid stabilization system protein ParE
MTIKWTRSALSDLERLHDFLRRVIPEAAARIVQMLAVAPDRLVAHPRLGAALDEFLPREVRHLVIGRYEMRYELQSNSVFILRIRHTREDR